MNNAETPNCCRIYVRTNGSLMIQRGDQAQELQLEPQAMFILAESLLSVAAPDVNPADLIELGHAIVGRGLQEAQANAIARSGARTIIENAKEPNGNPVSEH